MNRINIIKAVFIIMALIAVSPYGSAPVGLILGIALALIFGNPFLGHTKRYSAKVLSYSVVGLGAGMNLLEVMRAGLSGLGLTLVSIVLTLTAGVALGKLMKTEAVTSLLISVGTAICGGSAIAAIGPVVRAKPHEMTVALVTVFMLNALALVLFPVVGHSVGLTQTQFGLWSALAIHDTSSVVGAGLQYGAEALHVGTTVKLARALWIVPLTMGLSWKMKSPSHSSKLPWFILGFLMVAAVVTWVPVLQPAGHVVELVARRGLVLALFLIGANLTPASLREAGLRPFLQGFVLWIMVAVTSLVAILTMG